MMIFLNIILAYGLAWLMGWLVLELIDNQREINPGFKAFSAWLIGSGLLTMQMFVPLSLGMAFSYAGWLWLAVSNVLLLSLLIYINQRRIWLARLNFKIRDRQPGDHKTWKKMVIILVFAVMVTRVLLALWQVTHVPTYEFDAWNNWNLKAKVIAQEQQLPLDTGDSYYLGGGIVSYPLNVSLWKVWLAEAGGGWSEKTVNTMSVAVYISLLGLFYFSLPKKFSKLAKMGSTFLLSGLPFLYLHSWIAYADLQFSAYLFLLLICLLKLLENGKSKYLLLAALSLALAVWTKNEGFIVIGPVIVLATVILAFKKKISWKKFGIFWLLTLAAASPWLVFRTTQHLDILSGDSSTFNFVMNSGFLKEWFTAIFLRSNFNFLFLLLIVVLVWQVKNIWQKQSLRYLVAVFVILFIVNNSIILFTDRALDLGALVRVNLQLAPIAFYILIILLSEVRGLDKLFLSSDGNK